MLAFNKSKDNVSAVWFVPSKPCFKKWSCKKEKIDCKILNKKWPKYIQHDILNLIYALGFLEDTNNFYKITDIYHIHDIKQKRNTHTGNRKAVNYRVFVMRSITDTVWNKSQHWWLCSQRKISSWTLKRFFSYT